MNKYLFYLIFLLLPVLYFLTAFILKSAQGPYYLNFYDPGYVYLISSLNIAQGFGVGHFDHPGTTVQILGSVIIRICFLICGKDPDIAADVLSGPEEYLFILNTTFILINSVTLIILGIAAYKFTKNIYLSIFLQLSPFASMEIFYGSIIVSPDNFLITVSLLFICALLYYWFRTDENCNPPFKLILAFGIICGLGLATKLNFIPLVFIPFFLIKGYKNKMYFWILTIISFILFISPILADISTFAEWVERLVLNSGKYGKGDSNVINANLLLPNLKQIFSKDAVFTFSFLVLILSFVLSLLRYFKEKQTGAKYFTKINKIMLSLLFAVSLQILLVAKHYAQYYLIPSMMLSIIIFAVCIYIILPFFEKANKSIKPEHYIALIFILIAAWSAFKIFESYNEAVYFKNEALRSEKFIKENYQNDMVISAFSSANRECALAFSVRYAAKKKSEYEKFISKINKQYIFYDPWDNSFYKSKDKENLKNDLLLEKTKGNKKIILQMFFGSPEKFVEKLNEVCEVKNSAFREVFINGNGGRIFEITIGN